MASAPLTAPLPCRRPYANRRQRQSLFKWGIMTYSQSRTFITTLIEFAEIEWSRLLMELLINSLCGPEKLLISRYTNEQKKETHAYVVAYQSLNYLIRNCFRKLYLNFLLKIRYRGISACKRFSTLLIADYSRGRLFQLWLWANTNVNFQFKSHPSPPVPISFLSPPSPGSVLCWTLQLIPTHVGPVSLLWQNQQPVGRCYFPSFGTEKRMLFILFSARTLVTPPTPATALQKI